MVGKLAGLRGIILPPLCWRKTENDALLFFNYITFRHHNIRFTKEKEIDHKIPFLDVLIKNDTHFSVTSVCDRKPSRACWLIILALYRIPTNWVSSALLLMEPTRSTIHSWVSTKTSRNSLKSLKLIFLQPIWLKGSSIGTTSSPVMSEIPRSLFQKLHLPFILNYLTLALFLKQNSNKGSPIC